MMASLMATTAALRPAVFTPPLACARPQPRAAAFACAGDELDAFHSWLQSKGASLGSVTGKRLDGFGLSLVATGDCATGDTLLTLPASLHLTPTKAKASPVGQAVDGVIPADDDSANLALGLLHEFSKGEAGDFWPYLAILPSADDMVGQPLLWSDDELSTRFAGSHLCETVRAVKSGLHEQWEAIESRVVPNYPQLFPPSVFNLQGYLYAQAIVLTRALPFGDELSLLPYLDLANHQGGAKHTCSIGVAKKPDADDADAKLAITPCVEPSQMESLGVGEEVTAVLTAGAPLGEGEQAFIDYGEAGFRSSWEMLYTYGFVPGDSPDAWMASGGRPLFFDGVAADDPLSMQKRAMLVALGAGEEASEGTWLDLQPRKEQCEMMAPLLRLAALADDGTEPLAADLAAWKADPQALWERMQSPLSDETEARVAAQVLATCETALDALPSAETLLPASAGGDDSADAERSRLAARVMLGERAALEACVSVWQSVADKPEAKVAAAAGA